MYQKIFVIFIFAWLLSSCVPTKKYEELDKRYRSADRKVTQLQKSNEYNEKVIADLEQKAALLENLREELNETKQKLASLEGSHQQLQKSYDNALVEKDKLITTYSEDMAAFSRELATKEKDLNDQKVSLDSLMRDIEMRERKLTQLRDESNQQKEQMDMLKSTITEALNSFSKTDLSIREKDGKIYVSLSQELLFAKGSNVIDNQGRKALIQLASVLRDNREININVEGHTDSDGTPFRNWQLSVERATAVVQILTANGLNPERIIASGRAFYSPVAPNDTEENKNLNRRTEIILEPNLEILYKLFENEGS
ncbi:OmpA family protein [Membranihabitans marinus]